MREGSREGGRPLLSTLGSTAWWRSRPGPAAFPPWRPRGEDACRKLTGLKELTVGPPFPWLLPQLSQGMGLTGRPPLQRKGWAGKARRAGFSAQAPPVTPHIQFHRLLQTSCSEQTQKVEGGFPKSKEDRMNVGFITGTWQRQEPHFLP